MPPDHVIARIEDATTREAVMTVRSEMFRAMEQRDKRHDMELNRLMSITNLLTQQQTQLLTRFEDFARGTTQFQESLGRVMNSHETEDKRRFGAITKVFVYGLGSAVMILLGAIGFLIVHSFVLQH